MSNQKEIYYQFLWLLSGKEGWAKSLAEELFLSDTQPSLFYEQHEADLMTRHVKAGDKDQTLIYLINRAIEENLAYELDWKADSNELNHACDQLSNRKLDKPIVSEADEDPDEGMWGLLDTAEGALKELDYAIFHFPFDGDGYVISLIHPISKIKELEANLPF